MIDILLSTYNGEKYLSEQLDSLFSQSYNDFRIIVRDDGSSDKTKDILLEYKNKFNNKLDVYFENNVGPKNSFFELIKKSTNDYVMFCDQDDIWLDNKLEIMINVIKQYNNIPTLVYCDLKVVDENLNIICNSFYDYQGIDRYKNSFFDLVKKSVFPGCSLMLNRKLVEIIKYADVNNIRMHDCYVGLIASYFGNVVYIDEKLNLYRQHSDNTIGARDNSLKFYINRLRKYTKADLLNYIKYLKDSKKDYQLYEFYINYKDALSEEDNNKIVKILKKGHLL